MNEQQLTAIRTFARVNGRTWKAALRDAWMTGNYRDYGVDFDDAGYLQQLRNTLGPAWLVRYRLPQQEAN